MIALYPVDCASENVEIQLKSDRVVTKRMCVFFDSLFR